MTIFKTTTLASLVAALVATSGMATAQTAAPQAETPPAQAEAEAMPGAATERGGMRARMMARTMERLDTDGSGDISAEEFAARGVGRIVEADADGDGILSVEEIVDHMEQRRAERREARLLRRFDIDGDGTITVEELERHQEKRFALMDRNDDGVLSAEEMPRRQGMRGHGRPGGQRGGGMGWHGGR